MPTLLAAAGHGDQARLQLDGMNLLPLLQGEMPVQSRKLFWRYKARAQAAVREGNWKYLKIDGKEYLFDLSKDERERANLKAEMPDRFAQLKQDFEAWNATMLPYPKASFSHDMQNDIL
jgi:arylsulfatase A-like enzyme